MSYKDFDFNPANLEPPLPRREPIIRTIYDVHNHKEGKETSEERVRRMLRAMYDLCRACSLCELGRSLAEHKKTIFSPHVFSNRNPSRWVIVGQNPGYNECIEGEPFVGQSGKVFDKEIKKNGLTRDKFYITNTVKCLRYNARILLADGSTKLISHIVRDKYDGYVLSFDGEKFVPKRIINWYKSDLGNRNFVKVSYENARRDHGVVLTNDHMILTNNGWKKSEELRGDLICTNNCAPNKILERVFIGTMLGDSCIVASNWCCGHGPKQVEYCRYKGALAESFGDVYFWDASNKGVQFRSKASRYFAKMKKEFYNNGYKKPLLLSNSPETLAFWYMDDGFINKDRGTAHLCTDGFLLKDVEYLSTKLREFGYENSIFSHHGYNRIRLLKESSRRFFTEISKYVHPSMRYKLPVEYKESEFVDLNKQCRVIPLYDKATVSNFKYRDKSAYCIDVEDTHNFVTSSGVVVHNCYTNNNVKPKENSRKKCEHLLKMELELLNPLLVITLGSVAFGSFCPDKVMTPNLGKILESSRYGVKVFPVYHPSPRNLSDPKKKEKFNEDIKMLCKLIKAKEKE